MSTPVFGNVIGGHYRLLGKLGEGGMSTVYEAEHTLTAKRAAIKRLHPSLAGASHEQRLVHEARATSRVQHENVVHVYDVVAQDGDVFLVMELLHGDTLSDVLARGELTIPALLDLLLPAMRGMVAAHAVGVVHRDIKPENILLARMPGYASLVPKVIDFGISKIFEPDGEHVTRTGVTMGTPRYVSYEQLLGARGVDARADVYAFGVILYEALTGRAPYGEARSLTEQVILFATVRAAAPRALRAELPSELSRVVERAVAKEREQRWQSLEAVVQALEPYARDAHLARLRIRTSPRISEIGPTDLAPPTTRLRHSLPTSRPARRFAAVGAALLVLALIALARPSAPHEAPRRADPAAKPAPAPAPAADRPATAEPEPLDATTPVAAAPEPFQPPRRRIRTTPTPAEPTPARPASPEPDHRAGDIRRDEF